MMFRKINRADICALVFFIGAIVAMIRSYSDVSFYFNLSAMIYFMGISMLIDHPGGAV